MKPDFHAPLGIAGVSNASAKGFTLIELLISITIVGVILVIILGALRIGVRAWESGERDIEVNQRQQIVLSLMNQQMASICWIEIQKEEEDPYYFTGKTNFVEFVSSVSIVPGNAYGKVYVAYRIVSDGGEGMALEVAEQPLAKVDPGKDLYEPDDSEFRELISGAEDMSFEFLVPSGENESVWEENFASDSEAGIPAAVRFSLKMTEKTPPVSVIARIIAEQNMLEQTDRGLGR
ncbi:MAG: type II secretion system GspH family protein [Desulfobacterales bacterium]|jgi:general secretion pathway protein J|nr:type II secretion system GspH family protein [Desulfobacterales bacterium]